MVGEGDTRISVTRLLVVVDESSRLEERGPCDGRRRVLLGKAAGGVHTMGLGVDNIYVEFFRLSLFSPPPENNILFALRCMELPAV